MLQTKVIIFPQTCASSMFHILVNPPNHSTQKSEFHLYLLEFQVQFQVKETQLKVAWLENIIYWITWLESPKGNYP